jgi:hypothetical protein
MAKPTPLDAIWRKVEAHQELTLDERKLLHAELAKDPSLPGKIDEAMAEVRRAIESGELRRSAPGSGDRGTRKAAS